MQEENIIIFMLKKNKIKNTAWWAIVLKMEEWHCTEFLRLIALFTMDVIVNIY